MKTVIDCENNLNHTEERRLKKLSIRQSRLHALCCDYIIGLQVKPQGKSNTKDPLQITIRPMPRCQTKTKPVVFDEHTIRR